MDNKDLMGFTSEEIRKKIHELVDQIPEDGLDEMLEDAESNLKFYRENEEYRKTSDRWFWPSYR